MEDALVPVREIKERLNKVVLILVVMEDALVHSGGCYIVAADNVLILVVMEDALVLQHVMLFRQSRCVLILVVMEDALVPQSSYYRRIK
mgnify:CR=1 FL=1